MLLSRVFTDEMSAYSVDDFPEPVGPVTTIAPCGAWNAVTKRSLSYCGEPEAREVHRAAHRVEQTEHDRLARGGRNRRDAHVDRAAGTAQREPTVLGKAVLRDVEAAHDLESADHRAQNAERCLRRVVQDAVDAHADHDVARRGLDVEVGGAVGDGLLEERVDELDDGRVVDERAVADLGLDVVVVDRVVEGALDEVGAGVGVLDRGEQMAGVGERGEDRLAR